MQRTFFVCINLDFEGLHGFLDLLSIILAVPVCDATNVEVTTTAGYTKNTHLS